MGQSKWQASEDGVRLLVSVAEQLKMPLLHIARQVELVGGGGDLDGALELIRTRADSAIRLVDSYLLGIELAGGQMEFELEPVSVSSVLNDTAHQLDLTARQYGVSVELHLAGKYGPVMAHARGLQAALLSLGLACIESHPSAGVERPLRLEAYKTSQGIVAGLYGITDELRAEGLRTGRQLLGRSRQPLTGFSASSGAGVFVADLLLQSMASQLRVARHNLQYGLAATLQPSRQLQLV
jgi:hypothetical protein